MKDRDDPNLIIKRLHEALSSKHDKYIFLALAAHELALTAHAYGIGPESPRYEREKELLMALWALSKELTGDPMELCNPKLYSAVPDSRKNAPDHFNDQTSRWMDPMIEEERKKLERWGQEQKKRWAEDPWIFTRSAITTLLHAADAMVRQPEQRDKWFDQMLGEITDPLRAWWAKLKEDYDRNPSHKAAWRDKTADGALRHFYLECETGLVELFDPHLADERRAKHDAEIAKIPEEYRPKTDRNCFCGPGWPPVRSLKLTETPDELVELAISRLVEACRAYWTEAKANRRLPEH
jgi:hypothetical protein